MKNKYDLFSFLNQAKSIYHIVDYSKKYLLENGFKEVFFENLQKFEIGGKYFTVSKGAIFAFRIDSVEDGFFVVGSHTDSPSIAIKHNPIVKEREYVKLNTEIYGGPILSTWFDRPLSIAGCVHVEGEDSLNPKEILFDFEKNVCIIPNLAIHMNREVNNGFAINKQKHMIPVLSLDGEKLDNKYMIDLIAAKLGIKSEAILSYDLNLYDTQKACFVGINDEMISSKKLDNVAMLQASLKALVESKPGKGIKLVAGFDAEEIGSTTKNGANSNLLSNIAERILISFGKNREEFLCALEKSFIISADMAHAVHPNFSEKSDITNKPEMNKGIVIKQSCNKKYTSDSKGTSTVVSLCKKAGISYQIFVNRSDEPGGSTIGPISSSHFPIDSVDVGNPMLSMHSIRELAGSKDHEDMYVLFKTLYQL